MSKKITLAHLTMLVVIILGAVMWSLKPEGAVAMFMLPVAALGLRLAHRMRPGKWNAEDRRRINLAMLGGGLVLAVALGASIAETLALFSLPAGEIPKRASGVILGTVFAVYANFIPKAVAPAAKQALLRFAGWAFVLAGLGYALSWLVLPLAIANIAATLVMGTVVVIVAVRAGRLYMACRRPAPSKET